MTPGVDSFTTPGGIPVTVITWPRPEDITINVTTRTVEEHAAQAGLLPDDPDIFQVHVDKWLALDERKGSIR